MLTSLIDLLYPRICASCAEPIQPGDDMVCHSCFSKMAFCPYRSGQIHPIEKIFWGRSAVAAATSLLVFSKQGIGQELLHRLKYKGDREIGVYMGKLLGNRLSEYPEFAKVEGVIPVPLFERKKQLRGYNQSEVVAGGIAEVTGKPLITNYLQRIENNSSQTRKGRLERSENVRSAFSLDPRRFPNAEHLLLIDDVITTGSTLEACINLLSGRHKVSVATLAYQ
ncbi:MAG: ComF family protein [Bacteroidota bacterium]